MHKLCGRLILRGGRIKLHPVQRWHEFICDWRDICCNVQYLRAWDLLCCRRWFLRAVFSRNCLSNYRGDFVCCVLALPGWHLFSLWCGIVRTLPTGLLRPHRRHVQLHTLRCRSSPGHIGRNKR